MLVIEYKRDDGKTSTMTCYIGKEESNQIRKALKLKNENSKSFAGITIKLTDEPELPGQFKHVGKGLKRPF